MKQCHLFNRHAHSHSAVLLLAEQFSQHMLLVG